MYADLAKFTYLHACAYHHPCVALPLDSCVYPICLVVEHVGESVQIYAAISCMFEFCHAQLQTWSG